MPDRCKPQPDRTELRRAAETGLHLDLVCLLELFLAAFVVHGA